MAADAAGTAAGVAARWAPGLGLAADLLQLSIEGRALADGDVTAGEILQVVGTEFIEELEEALREGSAQE